MVEIAAINRKPQTAALIVGTGRNALVENGRRNSDAPTTPQRAAVVASTKKSRVSSPMAKTALTANIAADNAVASPALVPYTPIGLEIFPLESENESTAAVVVTKSAGLRTR
jgi:hypothetical protein